VDERRFPSTTNEKSSGRVDGEADRIRKKNVMGKNKKGSGMVDGGS